MTRRGDKGLRKLPDGSVAAVVHGGEPIDGCAPVEVLLHASGRADALEKARAVGVWSPSISKFTKPSKAEADLASDGQARWRLWLEGGPWRPESDLRRAT